MNEEIIIFWGIIYTRQGILLKINLTGCMNYKLISIFFSEL
jgi:hypothetical protein